MERPCYNDLHTSSTIQIDTLMSLASGKKKTLVPKHQFCNCKNYKRDCSATCENVGTNVICPPNCNPGICQNQLKEKFKNVEGLRVFNAGLKGLGLRTSKDIAKDSVIIEYVGELITKTAYEDRMDSAYRENHHFYGMDIGSGLVIDNTNINTRAKYINHSCSPNTRTEVWYFWGIPRLFFLAARDIKKLEEITIDYKFKSYGNDVVCNCLSPTCRGFVNVNGSQRIQKQHLTLTQKRKATSLPALQPKKRLTLQKDVSIKLVNPCKCEICGKVLSRKDQMPSHVASHSALRPFICTKSNCTYAAKRKDKLLEHMRRMHKENIPQRIIDDRMKKFQCSQCLKKFTTIRSKKRHECTLE